MMKQLATLLIYILFAIAMPESNAANLGMKEGINSNINTFLLVNVGENLSNLYIIIGVLIIIIAFLIYSKINNAKLFVYQNKLRFNQEEELTETIERLTQNEQLLNESQRIAKIAYLERNFVTGDVIYSDNIWNIYEISLNEKEKYRSYFDNFEFIHPNDKKKYEESIEKIKKDNVENYNIEYRAITIKGNIVNIKSTGTRFINAEGKLERLLIIIQDITEKNKIEEEIRKYERKFIDVFKHSPLILSISTLNEGVFIDVNNRFLYALNYTRDEVIGKSVRDLKIYHDYKDRYRIVALLKEKGYYNNFSAKFISKNGSVRDGMFSGSIFESDGQQLYLSIVSDITEIKNTELALIENEEKYKTIVENTNDGIFIFSEHKLIYTNTKLNDILGYNEEELMQMGIVNLIHVDDRPMIRASFENIVGSSKENTLSEIRIISKDTTVKICEFSKSNIVINGKDAVLGFVHDITDLRTAELELRIFNKYLEEKVAMELKRREQHDQALLQKTKLEFIGEMAAGMAHEINQPLTGITMGLDNILNKANSSGVDQVYLKEKLKTLFGYVTRIENIIEHVRTFSRDQQITIFEKYSINETIENALLLVRKTYVGNNIDINFECPTLLYARGNKYKFEQVMLNLLSNAKDAIMEKERHTNGILLNKTIDIILKEEKEMNIILVKDNGIGIKLENIDNIFKPFYTTKEANKGTGLGLSIAYGIINEMKGEIETESIENEYTLMKISLPKV